MRRETEQGGGPTQTDRTGGSRGELDGLTQSRIVCYLDMTELAVWPATLTLKRQEEICLSGKR